MEDTQNAVAGDIGSAPICATCQSERVVVDAWACWNPASGMWELENTFDDAHCHRCEGSTSIQWVRADALVPLRVRELNDRFRCHGLGNGSVMITSGVQALGDRSVAATIRAIQAFDDFSDDNDPWGEHDFGAVQIEGEKVFFKIDYYTPDLSAGSENPANEGVTHRVLAIMLSSEY